jgi:hypothetical protein
LPLQKLLHLFVHHQRSVCRDRLRLERRLHLPQRRLRRGRQLQQRRLPPAVIVLTLQPPSRSRFVDTLSPP